MKYMLKNLILSKTWSCSNWTRLNANLMQHCLSRVQQKKLKKSSRHEIRASSNGFTTEDHPSVTESYIPKPDMHLSRRQSLHLISCENVRVAASNRRSKLTRPPNSEESLQTPGHGLDCQLRTSRLKHFSDTQSNGDVTIDEIDQTHATGHYFDGAVADDVLEQTESEEPRRLLLLLVRGTWGPRKLAGRTEGRVRGSSCAGADGVRSEMGGFAIWGSGGVGDAPWALVLLCQKPIW